MVCLLCECVRQLYAEHEVPSHCAHRNPASSLASTLARAIYLWDPASSVIQNAKLVLTLKLCMDTKDTQFFGLDASDVEPNRQMCLLDIKPFTLNMDTEGNHSECVSSIGLTIKDKKMH